MALLRPDGLTAQYGQFKALFGVDLHGRGRRMRGHHRRERRGQDHADALDHRGPAQRARA